jgi:uncharacterized phiE125 gp8 family phage protein
MTSTLITPPALAVDLASAKEALKIDGPEQDALVEAWTAGIIDHAEHVTQRSFLAQTWRATLPAFSPELRLPSSPVISISSVKYVDTAGVEQTLPSSAYTVVGDCLAPAYGSAWPATRQQPDAVTVEGVFGYGETPEDLPNGIRLYVLAKLVESFDPATRLEKDTVQASFIDRLLDRFKRY